MTDPRISTVLPPRVTDQGAPLNRGEAALRILSAGGDLQSVRRPVQLQGTVSAVSKDGASATIHTAKGDVTVQLRNNTPLQQGQTVELDVPPGQPPRQAVVRADPAPVQQDTRQGTGAPSPATSSAVSNTASPSSLPETSPSSGGMAETEASSASSAAGPSPAVTPRAAQPPVQNVLQNVLPPDLQSALTQELENAVQQGAAVQAPADLPENAIVRLLPVSGLLAIADLLPMPAVLQALIEAAAQGPAVLQQALQGVQSQKSLLQLSQSSLSASLPVAAESGLPGLPDIKSLAAQLVRLNTLAATGAQTPQGGMPSGFFDARVISLRPPSGALPGLPSGVAGAFTPAEGEAALKPQPGTVPGASGPITAGPVMTGPLKAEVVALLPNRMPLLALALPGVKIAQPFVMQFPVSNLDAGAKLMLMPQPAGPTENALPQPSGAGEPDKASPDGATPPAALLEGWTWPTMDETVQTLSQMMPQARMAQSFTANLPSPATPQAMAPAVMFFMAAVQSGDLASWFGDKAISALRRDLGRGGDLLNRLTQDANGLARTMDTPVAQDWRGLAIPLHWQNEISKLHLYYRQQGGEKEDDAGGAGERSTRFIFDLNLVHMGDVQVDGLMKARQLDVILRTRAPLSHGMQAAMRKQFFHALEAGGLKGELGFQNRPEQWMAIKVDARQAGLLKTI